MPREGLAFFSNIFVLVTPNFVKGLSCIDIDAIRWL
jgi:hypothetical protein